jgi:exosortase/archaeosortase family protein
VLFLALFSALQIGWELSRGGPLEQFVIHDATVRPAVALIRRLTPDIAARAAGFSVQAPGGGLNIQNGCEGTEALFLLLAAFLAAPLGRWPRIAGLACGVLLVYALNQARIVTLFYAWRASPERFDLLHGSVLPVAIVLLVSAYFYAWLAIDARRTAAPG